MAKTIIADRATESDAQAEARIAAEAEKHARGFQGFSWFSAEAAARHGTAVTEAFDLARNILHGNVALLALLEFPENHDLGVSRTGDIMRFLVAVNELAAKRVAELDDQVEDEVRANVMSAGSDFEARR